MSETQDAAEIPDSEKILILAHDELTGKSLVGRTPIPAPYSMRFTPIGYRMHCSVVAFQGRLSLSCIFTLKNKFMFT